MNDSRHWVEWHAGYEDPHSSLSCRLAAVQRRLSTALDARQPGLIRLASMCAGQGRDVIETLEHHHRAVDVDALLVEMESNLVSDARSRANKAGLSNVRVRQGDASTTSAYLDSVPVDIMLVCGVFGNISDADIGRTIATLPHLLSPGGTVIWTRHRNAPDATPTIRRWFAEQGFNEDGFDGPETPHLFGVGTNSLVAEPRPFAPGVKMFTFEGDGSAAHT